MCTYESDSLSVSYPPVILFGALEEKDETKHSSYHKEAYYSGRDG